MKHFLPEIGNTENSKNNFQILYEEHGTPDEVEFIDGGKTLEHTLKMYWYAEAPQPIEPDAETEETETEETEAEETEEDDPYKRPLRCLFFFTGFGWNYGGTGAVALVKVLTTLGFEDTIKARVFEEELSGKTFIVNNDGQWTE